jgi:hypothetical protein
MYYHSLTCPPSRASRSGLTPPSLACLQGVAPLGVSLSNTERERETVRTLSAVAIPAVGSYTMV